MRRSMITLAVAAFVAISGPVVAGIMFDPAVTEKITPLLAFKKGDPNFDPNFSLIGSGKADIEFGAEGELEIATTFDTTRHSGRLTDVVERKFEVTGDGQSLQHTLLTQGDWMTLQTKNAAGAFYHLTLTDTDEVFEVRKDGTIRRAILTDVSKQDEVTKGKMNGNKDIKLSKNQSFKLLPGNYLLRSTIDIIASYENANWGLNLRDLTFGPQGIGSGGDEKGFQSRLITIPEPASLILLGIGVLGLLGYAWRYRGPAAA